MPCTNETANTVTIHTIERFSGSRDVRLGQQTKIVSVHTQKGTTHAQKGERDRRSGFVFGSNEVHMARREQESVERER